MRYDFYPGSIIPIAVTPDATDLRSHSYVGNIVAVALQITLEIDYSYSGR